MGKLKFFYCLIKALFYFEAGTEETKRKKREDMNCNLVSSC